MYELIGFCFTGGDNAYVAVTKYGAKWISDLSTYSITFDKKALKQLLSIY